MIALPTTPVPTSASWDWRSMTVGVWTARSVGRFENTHTRTHTCTHAHTHPPRGFNVPRVSATTRTGPSVQAAFRHHQRPGVMFSNGTGSSIREVHTQHVLTSMWWLKGVGMAGVGRAGHRRRLRTHSAVRYKALGSRTGLCRTSTHHPHLSLT